MAEPRMKTFPPTAAAAAAAKALASVSASAAPVVAHGTGPVPVPAAGGKTAGWHPDSLGWLCINSWAAVESSLNSRCCTYWTFSQAEVFLDRGKTLAVPTSCNFLPWLWAEWGGCVFWPRILFVPCLHRQGIMFSRFSSCMSILLGWCLFKCIDSRRRSRKPLQSTSGDRKGGEDAIVQLPSISSSPSSKVRSKSRIKV